MDIKCIIWISLEQNRTAILEVASAIWGGHYQKDEAPCARCFPSCRVYINKQNKYVHNMSGGMCHKEKPSRSEDKAW